MKNIEKLLQDSRGPKPNRELPGDFTEQVVRHITQEPPKTKREWWARYLHIRMLRLLPRPAVWALSVCMLIGLCGSAYAIVTSWPDTSATLRQSTMLPSGNRIVAVDTDNCLGVQSLDGTAKPDGKGVTYYEVRKNSALTNEQVVAMVQANCEEDISSNAMSAVVKERFGTIRKSQKISIMSSGGLLVRAVDNTSITLGFDPRWYDKESTPTTSDVVYRRIAPDVAVYDRARAIALSDLRAGDSVKILVRDEHKLPSEGDPNDPNHWDEPELTVIEAIIKVQPPATPPITFYRLLGTDFVRAEPCDSSPTGFCRAYEFIKPDFTKTEPN